jgi:hypothetical protein
MRVSSYEGGGQHVHLRFIMTNVEYFTVATVVFLSPENLGPVTKIIAGTMGVQIAEMGQLYTDATCIYLTHNNVDHEFKKMTINALEDQYLNAVYDEIFGYTNCTSLQLLTHLLTYYAMIPPTELTQNYERLNAPYADNQQIENLFQQIQDAQEFAVAGVKPYGDVIIVTVAFTIVFNNGFSPDDCRTWQARAIADNMWLQFKLDFAAAH